MGAFAAALALFAAQVQHGEPAGPGEQARLLASRLVLPPVPGGAYVTSLVDAVSPPGPPGANGPSHDGMSLRELRPVDLSGQVTLPLVAGRF